MGGRGSGGNRSVRGADPSKPDNGPEKPEGLREAVSRKWDRLIAQLPEGTLRRIDGHMITLLAELLDQADAISKRIDADPGDDRARRLLLGTVDRVARLSSLFGLTPTDRKRSQIEETKPDPDDPVEFMLSRIKADRDRLGLG